MRTALAAFPAMALVFTLTTVALAQDTTNAADVSVARSLTQEGIKLADSGDCAAAIDRLSRAEKLFHAPTSLARLGECQVLTGKIVEGTENLIRVVREPLAATAPSAFRDAQERARKVLDAAKSKVAKLKIAVAAPPNTEMTVKVDDHVVSSASLNVDRPTDPGEHTVEVSAPGFLTATQKVTLKEGASETIALKLDPDPNAPKAAPPPPVVPAPPPVQPAPTAEPVVLRTDPTAPNRVPAYVALGVGVVGVGLGTIFGILASGKKSDLDASCAAKVCPPTARDTWDGAKTDATVSTVGFVAGGVALAVGAVLLLTAKPSAPSVSFGLGGTGVTARF